MTAEVSADLSGCTALVTGGSSGIGAAIAAELGSRGAEVFVAGRRRAASRVVTSMVVDLTEPGAAARLVSDVVDRAGHLDILVNNAGVMIASSTVTSREEDWQRMAAVNLMAAADCSRAALPHLEAAAGGHRGCADLVFVGSLAGRAPTPGRAFYAATKSGIETFADVLRIELAQTAVRVGVVLPGLTDTGLRTHSDPEGLRAMAATADNLAGVEPMAPTAVADATAWLVCQPRAVSVTSLTIMPVGQAR